MTHSDLHSNVLHDTREAWLREGARLLGDKVLASHGAALPAKMAYACGFPKGSARAIGQCWDPVIAPDGTSHIFICPSQSEPTRVLDILLHEIIHAVVGIKEKHGGQFKRLARAVGLEGKLTDTVVTPGSALHQQLVAIAAELGDYPHRAVLKPNRKGKGGSGWVRLRSVVEETYTVVISPKALEAHGAPCDPWGEPMEQVS